MYTQVPPICKQKKQTPLLYLITGSLTFISVALPICSLVNILGDHFNGYQVIQVTHLKSFNNFSCSSIDNPNPSDTLRSPAQFNICSPFQLNFSSPPSLSQYYTLISLLSCHKYTMPFLPQDICTFFSSSFKKR